MNNSKITAEYNLLDQELKMDRSPLLRAREAKLVGIIEALGNISSSAYWDVIKEEILNGAVDTLKRRLSSETETIEMFRLQGQIIWAEKYSDLDKLAESYRNELKNIRNQLTGDGAP